ncbi:ArsR/SmtB family transcription factor [Natrialba aegyptia]|uniref:Regulatory protein ArsR n=1 Tax=Natrialba aegyptia DSM 13077 TaxID=1227491 RepID=M0B1T8_9EURY|nr:helix-turn-helix domain-containing protein [Natrialba aegyptia]ELZ04203.1 regulatory protein ArsR [Natrialba aegyptia DSM 13077]
MARLFPRRSETPAQDGQPRIVDLEGEDADAVFSALSSTTARQIYSCLDGEPGTPSDIAEAIDSSIQNVRYHLENLEDAGLVEVVDTWYSSRGNEMSVYATTDGPLIVTSDESTGSRLKTALSRLIGGVGALAGGSLLVQYGVARWAGASSTGGQSAPFWSSDDSASSDQGDSTGSDRETGEQGSGSGGGNQAESTSGDADAGAGTDSNSSGADDTDVEIAGTDGDHSNGTTGSNGTSDAADGGTGTDATPNDSHNTTGTDTSDPGASHGDTGGNDGIIDHVHDFATDIVDHVQGFATDVTDPLLTNMPPGLLFFLGGLTVLLAVTAYWYWFSPRPVR